MAIQKPEQLIEAPDEEILPPPEDQDPEEDEGDLEIPHDLHFCYKQKYPEYKCAYQAVKAEMRGLLQEAWETGDLMIRTDDEDNDKFFETLDRIKEQLPKMFEDYVVSHFPPLVQKWLLEGLEDEETGILGVALYKLTEKEECENTYGKLGRAAFEMEAQYSTEVYPVN